MMAPPTYPRTFALAALCLALAVPSISSSQQLGGRLLDLETNQPIPFGVLTLLTADSARVGTAVADGAGYWRLDVPGPGTYLVGAEGMGYEPWVAGPVEVGDEGEVNTLFHLRPRPIDLEPIEVNARAIRRYLEYAGFFERQRGNFGHFVAPEDIERRQASRLTDLLTAIPGVLRVSSGPGSVGPAQIQLRGSSLSHGGHCRPRVFVDGLMYSYGDSRPVRDREGDATEQAYDDALMRMDQGLSIDDIGHPSSIAAVEVYRSASQVPVQFGGTSVETLCGVIVIWTRTGRMPFGNR